MLNIDKQSRTPVYEQIIEQIERLILIGSLKPMEQIPSVRALSAELSINPNTIQKAYNDLEKRGITVSAPGVGRFISEDAQKILNSNRSEELAKLHDAVYELALADIPLEYVIETVTSAYKEAKNHKETRNEND